MAEGRRGADGRVSARSVPGTRTASERVSRISSNGKAKVLVIAEDAESVVLCTASAINSARFPRGATLASASDTSGCSRRSDGPQAQGPGSCSGPGGTAHLSRASRAARAASSASRS